MYAIKSFIFLTVILRSDHNIVDKQIKGSGYGEYLYKSDSFILH